MKYAITCTALLLLISCSNQRERQLIGAWQAFEITEEGEPLLVKPEEVRFEFQADNTYSYQSTLNYKETGTFRINNNYLLTRELSGAKEPERAVLIERLEADTLVLGMEEQGKKREVKLARLDD
ncbi:MAG: lipocalin family protein [Saprospiraceae bacterium]